MMKKSRADRRKTVDLSPEAIDRRLRELGQLYELGMQISRARWLGKLEDVEPSSSKDGGNPAPGGKSS